MMKFANFEVIASLESTELQQSLLQSTRPNATFPEESTKIYTDELEYWEYLRNIDLPSFLGIENLFNVSCPFCGGHDGTVSYFENEERWTFRCAKAKKTHNIVGLVQRLSGCSYSKAIGFIKSVYNVALEPTGKAKDLQGVLEYNIQITGDAVFTQRYPLIAKYLKADTALLPVLFQELSLLYNEPLYTENGDVVMLVTTKELCSVLGISDGKARAFMRNLALLGMVEVVKKGELSKSSKDKLEFLRGGHEEYPLIYRIIKLDEPQLDLCESAAGTLLPMRLTKGNLTMKTVYAIYGDGDSKYAISPNYSWFKRSAAERAAKEAIAKYSYILNKEIAANGYVLERDLPMKLLLPRQTERGEKYTMPVCWHEIRSAVIEACGCICVPANKDQLKLLGITDTVLSGNLLVPSESAYRVEKQIGEALNQIALHGYAFAHDYLPDAKANRKTFRDMMDTCGLKSVRLNDSYRKLYGITNVRCCTDILIEK